MSRRATVTDLSDSTFAALWRRAAAQASAAQPISVKGNPRHVVYQEDGVTLYRYDSDHGTAAQPLLIVYSLVNRPYLVDLQPKRSLVRALLDAGRSVYLLDWGRPEPADRFLGLEDYIDDYLRRCVRTIRDRHDNAPLDLLGVCQGGVFATCYAALYPNDVARLVNMVTPIDFHAGDVPLSRIARRVDAAALVQAFGNVSATMLNPLFISQKPYTLLAQRYHDMAYLADLPEALTAFLRIERWMYDSPDQAGRAYQQFLEDFYQTNKLVRNRLELDGKPVHLNALGMPILNVYAHQDHLIPPPAATALGQYVAGPYREIGMDTGHLGVFIGRDAWQTLYPQMIEWLQTS